VWERSLCISKSFNPSNLPPDLNGKLARYANFVPGSKQDLVGLGVVFDLLKTW
jgi:hypothetical protein